MCSDGDQPEVPDRPGQGIGLSGAFATTHWSAVVRAQQDDSAGAQALEELCRVYWLPVYSFIRRRRGTGPEETEDLTQGFFCELLERHTINRVKPGWGKFRTFLLKALNDFLDNERDKTQAWKRGGRHKIISLDGMLAAGEHGLEPAEAPAGEKHFDRDWAAALLNQVLSRLEKEYVENRKAALFAKLAPVMAQVDDGFYQQCAVNLGMSVDSAKVAMHRLRRRYGRCFVPKSHRP